MLLPEPLLPTKAMVFPAGTVSEKLLRIRISGLEGYEKSTFFSSTSPETDSNCKPESLFRSIAGLWSIIRKILAAATFALANADMLGADCPKALKIEENGEQKNASIVTYIIEHLQGSTTTYNPPIITANMVAMASPPLVKWCLTR